MQTTSRIFQIKKSLLADQPWHFVIRALRGRRNILAHSENYTEKRGAEKGIAAVKEAVMADLLASAEANGAERIFAERWEQEYKHKFGPKQDAKYVHGELLEAALYALDPDKYPWPAEWFQFDEIKIARKEKIQRLAIAGAFIAAEIDRLQWAAEKEQQ